MKYFMTNCAVLTLCALGCAHGYIVCSDYTYTVEESDRRQQRQSDVRHDADLQRIHPLVRDLEQSCDGNDRKCICTRQLEPMCGNDGKTYSNFCMACCNRFDKGNSALLTVTDGSCDGDDPFHMRRNGDERAARHRRHRHQRRHAHGSALERHKRAPRRRSMDSCDPNERSCECPRVIRQVCGNNGHSYTNFCQACCDKFEGANSQLMETTDGLCPEDQ